MPIDEPTRSKDFDFIRWYLLHDRATVFVEDDSWYLLVHTVCEHLQADNRCGIYETRPQICRDYSTVGCEYEDDWTYERYFETADQVAEYAEAVLKKKAGQGLRSHAPHCFHSSDRAAASFNPYRLLRWPLSSAHATIGTTSPGLDSLSVVLCDTPGVGNLPLAVR